MTGSRRVTEARRLAPPAPRGRRRTHPQRGVRRRASFRSRLLGSVLCGVLLVGFEAVPGGPPTRPPPHARPPPSEAPPHTSDPNAEPDDDFVEIIALARTGDADAWGQIYRRFAGPVYGFFLHQVRDQQVAEDLTAGVFV